MSIFFELLQVAIGNRQSLSRAPSPEEWEEIYEMSKKQALAGIAFAGVERLPREQLPPGRRIRQWAVKADKIREHNKQISAECRQISKFFEDNGFDCVILKGQGNFAYYPEWLHGLRSAGDIDVWAVPSPSKDFARKRNATLRNAIEDCYEKPVRKVIEFCQSKKKGEYVYYHNLDFPVLEKTPIEVHYRPTWLYNPFRNRKLQRYFASQKVISNKEEVKSSFVEYDGYKIPSVEFNVVFQLLHLYKHIFEEGIGLRQLLDYYFTIARLTPVPSPKGEGRSIINELGLKSFAGAVMYVMREVFAMPDEMMLCQPDEKRGRKLLEEIMIGGNFGKYDERYNWKETTNGSMDYRGASYAVARLRHNVRFLFDYPSEVLWEPIFRAYHWFWRRFKLWRYE